MTSLHTLIFYATPEHDCSYLEDQHATTMFVDPRAHVDNQLYTQLSQLGFRRSGSHYYRPHCQNCNACIPARVPVTDFKPNRSQKRCLNRNSECTVITRRPDYREEHYRLYERYITIRHSDGDMFPPSREQYESFLTSATGTTLFVEFWHGGCLMAVSVVDELQDGLSAIYTFFDPDLEHLSPGVYSVLWAIEETQRRKKPYLYLGYWIKTCPKMSYKIKYRPIELLVKEQWLRI
ncbi:MAG: arginyltransferase [Pseudomonadales bacterium]|uniref:Aspartate/glutamate leucyltransferase n=1 Tax=Oleiphilus messinensis TaxID=141451 RepID=A0A1Y0I6L0_9GAMM|nr:arginyltransferase [Oleiphilus messinensis]ARU56137.1 arginyl-tRNA-protein transferase [Oleiphilus messinensis]MCG8611372.1 arginyltransferase [Pseudomonadales bacterium]